MRLGWDWAVCDFCSSFLEFLALSFIRNEDLHVIRLNGETKRKKILPTLDIFCLLDSTEVLTKSHLGKFSPLPALWDRARSIYLLQREEYCVPLSNQQKLSNNLQYREPYAFSHILYQKRLNGFKISIVPKLRKLEVWQNGITNHSHLSANSSLKNWCF